MGYKPTDADIGLPKDLEYTDLLPPKESGLPEHYKVVVALHNKTATPPYFYGYGYIKPRPDSNYWVSTCMYWRDTTLGEWRPCMFVGGYNSLTAGTSLYPILPKYSGRKDIMVAALAASSLKDRATATAWIMPIRGTTLIKTGHTFRYDVGVDDENPQGVWRLNEFTKAQDYDVLTREESGVFYDVVVPYTRGALTVGTQASGYGQGAYYWYNYYGYGGVTTYGYSTFGVTYTCTQVEPYHKWQRVGL